MKLRFPNADLAENSKSLISHQRVIMAPHVQVLGECNSEHKSILSSEALQFFGVLQEKFGQRRLDLLNARKVAQAR